MVRSKAHLIETSIYYLKVLVEKGGGGGGWEGDMFFTGNFTASYPLQHGSDGRREMKYDLMFSVQLSVI